MRIARSRTRAVKGSFVHAWLLTPCIKTLIFPSERSRISKFYACGAVNIPRAQRAGMIYLYKYFRFLLQKWARKFFVACGAQNFAIFARKFLGTQKVEIGRYHIKVIHLLGSRPPPCSPECAAPLPPPALPPSTSALHSPSPPPPVPPPPSRAPRPCSCLLSHLPTYLLACLPSRAARPCTCLLT